MLLSVRLVFLIRKGFGAVCAQVAGKVRVLRGVPGALAVAAMFCVRCTVARLFWCWVVVQVFFGGTVRGLVLGAVPPAGRCCELLVKFRPEMTSTRKADAVFSLPATFTLLQGSGL